MRDGYSVNYSEKHYGLLYFEIVTPCHHPFSLLGIFKLTFPNH